MRQISKRASWIALAAYGVVNASAYCCLLPLWEGWDEGYHYGYVQEISVHGRFPVLRETDLSREIWDAYRLVPVSNFIQAFTRAPLNFSDYQKLDETERTRRRLGLDSIDPAERYLSQAGKWNIEAHQAPLAYLLMAAPDLLLGGAPLTSRVIWIRLTSAWAAVLLAAAGTRWLTHEMMLPEWIGCVALFWVFCTQMFYATSCHICNDWLCAPLMPLLLAAAIRAWSSGRAWPWISLGLIYSAALMTKAHFLALAPLLAGLAALAAVKRRSSPICGVWMGSAILLIAGPWYVRNVVLYKNLTGMVEATSGLTAADYWRSATTMPWLDSVASMAHGSLWTGNNSFTSFSALTLDVILALIALGATAYAFRMRGAEARIVEASILLYSIGLAYTAVAFHASSKGGLIAPMPWYAQVLLIPVALITIIGMTRLPKRLGMIAAISLTLVWSYTLMATWYVKLLPMYGGLGAGRVRVAALMDWYLSSGAARESFLKTICLVSPSVTWTLLGLSAAGGLLLTAVVVRLISKTWVTIEG